MKKIWKLLKQHLAADFNWKLYTAVGIFMAVFIFVNYRINLENGIIDRHTGKPIRILFYFLLHFFTYFSVSAIVFYYNRTFHHFRSRRYWIVTLVTLFFLSIDLGFPYLSAIVTWLTEGTYVMYKWTFGFVHNLIGFFTQAIPLMIFAWFFEKQRENFGVNNKNIDLQPYWQILMIVAPLVIVASFEAGFSNYYPMYRRYEITAANNPTDIPAWLFALCYETVYGMDFFNVEFLFRGALVIGVSQVIGKEAILPMVSVYCVLHFGKPLGECISSVFGGYILGVVAFYTRNIWGGVIVHVGLAWMMEIVAFIQKAFSS